MSRLLRLLTLCIAFALIVPGAFAGTIAVTDNNGEATTPGTLRAALAAANTPSCPAPCTITFASAMTIATTGTGGPFIVPNDTIVDGFSAPGSSPNTAAFPSPDNAVRNVVIDGISNTCCSGFSLIGNNSEVRGLIIRDYLTAVTLSGISSKVTGSEITGNSTGVSISNSVGSGATVGGPNPDDRNIIHGNFSAGVAVTGPYTNPFIENNFIGTNASGTTASANGTGIRVNSGVSGTAIGFTVGNLIAGNSIGIEMNSNGGVIENNIIGIGSGAGFANSTVGILINGGSNNTIRTNSITSNTGDGVEIRSGTGNDLRNNVYGNNGGIGIDLASASTLFPEQGPTTNDAGDADTGGNNLQNYPTISAAQYDPRSDQVLITFSYDSSASGNAAVSVELWKADGTGPNPEGLQFITSQCWGTSAVNQMTNFPAGGLTIGDTIVLTATGHADSFCGGSLASGTSEFSAPASIVLRAGLVINTNDSGNGSLRQAILDANSGACQNSFGGCDIAFAIPASFMEPDGTFIIRPLSPLPPISRSSTRIDGFSQQFFGGDTNPNGPEIVLNGLSMIGIGAGLTIRPAAPGSTVDNVTIEHLVIQGFAGKIGILTEGFDSLSTSENHEIVSCYIGTDAAGTSAVPNAVGIVFGRFSGFNRAGGFFFPSAAPPSGLRPQTDGIFGSSQANIISGNTGEAIEIFESYNNDIQTNQIGVGSDGSPLPNGAGIDIVGALAMGNLIGGTGTFDGNVIAHNTDYGIRSDALATENQFARNSIHSNGGLGIDLLLPVGVTPNDPGDADTGGNNLQNFPVITSQTTVSGQTTINGELNSTPSSNFVVEIFTNTAPDPTGYGEGENFVVAIPVTTDATGRATFSHTFGTTERWVTATATTNALRSSGQDTSEFGAVFNNPPVAVADSATTTTLVAVSIPVLSNDSDPDGDTILIRSFTQPANGAVSCSSTDCTYSSTPTFVGTDTFTYTITDPAGGQATATVTVTVNAANQPPVANNDSASTPSGTPVTVSVLANDSDPEGGALTITSFTQGSNGSVTCTAGSCTYSPNAGFVGTDNFAYTISDPGGLTSTAIVTVTVTNQAPIAVDDFASATAGTPVMINVLANDSDPEGGSFSITSFTGASNGTVTCSPTSCTYTANTTFAGADSFTYTITDSFGATDTATVTITVGSSNQPPIAVDDSASATAGTPVTINVLANDSDPEGGSFSIISFTGASNGTVTCSATSCTYTANTGFAGADSFTYTISDSFGATDTATVTINVGSGNSAPTANDDFATTQSNQPVTINVLANDSDPDGDSLTVVLFTNPTRGSASCTSAGQCTYTPFPNESGSDSFQYKVMDGRGGESIGTVFINITSCPEAPTPTFPAEGAQNVPTSGQFTWSGDADAFKVFYGPVGQGCSTARAFTPANSLAYSGLQGNTDYEFRVEAHNEGCEGVSSSCVRFRTASTCGVAPPTPLAPLAGTRVASPVVFSWTAVSGATQYRVFVVAGGTERLLGTTTSTSLTATLADGATSWFVVADGVPGCGELRSVATNFTICNAPSAPLAAIVGESTSGQTYTLSWTPVDGATRYEVLEANNASFNNAVSFTTTATAMEFTKTAETNAQPFFYVVRAFTECFNGFGPASRVVRVVVVPIPPREQPNTSANTPLGSRRPVALQVFVPGEPGQTLHFTARGDQPWMEVRPPSGILPPEGVTLEVLVDPSDMPNGTFTGTVIVEISSTASGRFTTHGAGTVSVPVSINLVTPVVPLDPGSPTSDSIIIPAVGHLEGADARWRSDVRIANIGSAVSRYIVAFTPQDQNLGIRQTTVEVNPGATTALDDIVRAWYGIGSLPGESSAGVLEVRPLGGPQKGGLEGLPSVALATVVSSRTYAQTQQGTLGEFIPGLLFERFIGAAGENQAPSILNLQQIAQNESYRTNVGLVEAAGQGVTALVSIFNAAGDRLDQLQVDVAPKQQVQLNSLLAQRGLSLNDGRIEVQVLGGEGRLTAYAAVIDNRTKDQLFVPATTLGQTTSTRYVMPGIADLNSGSALWRSDMRLFNSGESSQTATLTLFPQNNSGAPLTANITIEPGEIEVLNDIVRSVFGTSGIGGAVHVETPQPSELIVTGRTYNQTPNGTLGLFIPAVTPEQAIGAGERTLNIIQAEESVRFRTQVGIAEVTGNPATVELQVHIPGSLATPRFQIPLAANEFRQIPILQAIGVPNVYNARITMRVTSGEGRITAYGSVIDMRTNDSTYVPAQ